MTAADVMASKGQGMTCVNRRPDLSPSDRLSLFVQFARWLRSTLPEPFDGVPRPLVTRPQRISARHVIHPALRAYSRCLCGATPIVWVASVSRSGNTWLRYLLHNALFGEVTQAGEPEAAIPHWAAVLGAVDERRVRRTPARGCVLVKTHTQPFDQTSGAFRFLAPLAVGAIYLYRNPVDVCLSQIGHMRRMRKYPNATDRDLGFRFLDGALFPQERLWTEHVVAWHAVTRFPVLSLSFEELKSSTGVCLDRILRFLGEAPDADTLAHAVSRSNLASMRALEEARPAAFGHATPRTVRAHRFVNQGLSDQSIAHLGADFVQAFDRQYGAVMHDFGYERPLQRDAEQVGAVAAPAGE